MTAATPSLTGFSLSASSVAFGGTAPTITAPTSASSGAFTYTSSNTAVATISGSTVTVVGVGTSTITAAQAANGNYASSTTTATLTVTAALPAGAVLSGGLTWTRNNSTVTSPGTSNWTTANSTCNNLIVGGADNWRLPTQAELYALYTAGKGPLSTAGWTLDWTWSSTDGGAGNHYGVYLYNGGVSWLDDNDGSTYVSCVH